MFQAALSSSVSGSEHFSDCDTLRILIVLRCFFFRKKLFTATVASNYLLFAATIASNYLLFTATVASNYLLFAATLASNYLLFAATLTSNYFFIRWYPSCSCIVSFTCSTSLVTYGP